ncbi:unnamed protein product, partial [Musa acuminata subsp. burmannicoides]
MDQVYPDPIPAVGSASPAGHVGGEQVPPAVRHVGALRSAGSAFLWGPLGSVRPETRWTEDNGKV